MLQQLISRTAEVAFHWSRRPTPTDWVTLTPLSHMRPSKWEQSQCSCQIKQIFGGEAKLLKPSNIKMRSRPLKLSTCKVATVLSRMTSFCTPPPPNMTFYVNKLHDNSKSRLLQTPATFVLPVKPTDKPARAKLNVVCLFVLAIANWLSTGMDTSTQSTLAINLSTANRKCLWNEVKMTTDWGLDVAVSPGWRIRNCVGLNGVFRV